MAWIVAAALLAAAALGIAYYFSERVLNIRTYPSEAILAREAELGRIEKERIDALPVEEVEIRSPYGYSLYGWFVPAEGGTTRRTVVFSHGVTSSLAGMLKYADIFRRRGFNALLYDHRRHGRSGGKHTTYGYYEKRDLGAAVDWVYGRFGPDAVVGVFGESMGAATALQLAAIDDRLDFVVADCPYSDLAEQLAHRLKADYRLPPFPLLALTSLWCKLRAGFYIRDVSPIRDLAGIRAPVLLIHGDADDFVPMRMSAAMYERFPGSKSLYLAPGAAHAESWQRHREEYERKVEQFLRAHRLLPEAAVVG